MTTMRKTATLLPLIGLVLATWVMLPGCGEEGGLVASLPTAPSTQDDPANLPVPGASPLGKTFVPGTDGTGWTLVAHGWVTPLASVKVEGSRYSVTLPKGCVATRELITIRERDPMVVDVEFGPHGTWFLVPVEVTIDYKGSANDPESENYNGSEPTVYWYNPSAHAWQMTASVADKKLKKVTFLLEHFSRYAMADGIEDGEWQWTRTGKQTGRPAGEAPSE